MMETLPPASDELKVQGNVAPVARVSNRWGVAIAYFKSPIHIAMAVLAVGIVALAIVRAKSMVGTTHHSVLSESPLPAVLGYAPSFQLTERSGNSVSSADLQGQVWVADFIFTHCAGPCPLMSARMAKLQRTFAHLPNVKLVSFSVDPQRDTPAVLRTYADQYRADPARWWFLTGKTDAIKSIVVNGFKLGSIDNPILHSDRFVLVDRQGGIRGYFDSQDSEEMGRLEEAVRGLSGK